ncbi:hypothetical protein [Corynebacterium epidermidicanis]|uniref:ECF transporter S component n=1 Tax=Corynebacterium epidermidicanis TaxID=1050174 RepID=A0A0G3GLY5_9CORY|nr:hypothetical protein [Corynebacterium epidermidicanis]AKK02211.1 hypothetical protein CEPID_01630 [Corynebacterium epidermidicanis]
MSFPRHLLTGLAVILLILQWSIPVAMPISPWLMDFMGRDINWFVVVTLVVATLLLLLVFSRQIDRRLWLLVIAGVAADHILGEINARLNLPLYLDTIGSVCVGMLLGPLAGASTAALSTCMWVLIAPVSVPFATVNIVAGWLAGVFRQLDGFGNRLTVTVSGLIAGIACSIGAAPLTYSLRNSSVARFNFDIYSPLSAVDTYFASSLGFREIISDPVDITVVFLVTFMISPWLYRTFKVEPPYPELIEAAKPRP